jgi:hypothetical protein
MESSCKFDVHAERQQLEFRFAAPYFKSAAHPISPHEPLCQYILQNYTPAVNPSANTYFYGLWINRVQVSERSNSALR